MSAPSKQPADLGTRIGTARLLIEPLRRAHARELHLALREPRIYDYVPEAPTPSIRAMALRIQRRTRGPPTGSPERWLNWVVRQRTSRRVIGTLQATVRADRHRASVAYLFAPEYWGRGYASESLGALLASLRAQDGIATFEARVDARNDRSIRLLHRLGFTIIRTVPHAEFLHGAWGDEHVFRRRIPDSLRADPRLGRERRRDPLGPARA